VPPVAPNTIISFIVFCLMPPFLLLFIGFNLFFHFFEVYIFSRGNY
jgi:hypothetical protein